MSDSKTTEQELIDSLTFKIAQQNIEIEALKKMVERKNKLVKVARDSITEIFQNEEKIKEYWF